MTVIVVGRIVVKRESLDRFLEEVEKLETLTRAEDGCETYALALDNAATGEIAVVECWRDEPALRAHLETAHVKHFIETCGPMIESTEARLFDALNGRPVL